jgi:hypothetical protein
MGVGDVLLGNDWRLTIAMRPTDDWRAAGARRGPRGVPRFGAYTALDVTAYIDGVDVGVPVRHLQRASRFGICSLQNLAANPLTIRYY